MKWVLGVEFVVPFSSRSQVVNFLKWKHHYLRENNAIFQSNYDLFTQYLFLKEKKESFDDFFMTTWEQDNKSERKKEPQIPRLGQIRLWNIQLFIPQNKNSSWLILPYSTNVHYHIAVLKSLQSCLLCMKNGNAFTSSTQQQTQYCISFLLRMLDRQRGNCEPNSFHFSMKMPPGPT